MGNYSFHRAAGAAVCLGLAAAQLTTPLRGLSAAVVALLISGVISIVVLNKQRAAMGVTVAEFFGRINSRIEASTRAEDEEDDNRRLSQGDQEAKAETVDKNE